MTPTNTPTTVLATGVFDLLHPGHLYFLGKARKLGDRLVVVVANDETVRRQKREPIFSAEDRVTLIRALRMVDEAHIGDPIDHLKIVKAIRPAIIALGHDQTHDPDKLARSLAELDLHPRIHRLDRYQGDNVATRGILEKIRREQR